MKALKKIGLLVVALGVALMALSSTGCLNSHGVFQRPGWIVPTR